MALSRLRQIGSHLLTALVAAAVTSAVWILALNSRGADSPVPTRTTPVPEPPKLEIGPSGLAIPVAGVKPEDLVDTYKQARAGGARVHDAIDIMAPAGTPVVAAAPGVIEKLFYSKGGGGITAYVRSEDGSYIFYYAHLKDYAPGLEEGQKVKRGDPIGTVGSTGNASPSGPHLHFAIHRMAPEDDWHAGEPINPYPLLAGTKARR